MSQQIIKTGTVPNDKTGDSLFAAFNKVNDNFTELYTLTNGLAAGNITQVSGSVPNGFFPTYYNPTTGEFIVVVP